MLSSTADQRAKVDGDARQHASEQLADLMNKSAAASARYQALRDAKRKLLDAGMIDAYQLLVPSETEAWEAHLAAATEVARYA